ENDWKARKESFISGYNGTSFVEVTVFSAGFPLCIFVRAILLSVLPNFIQNSKLLSYFFDFFVLIFPGIIMVTGLSEYIYTATFLVLIFIASYNWIFLNCRKSYISTPIQASYSDYFFKDQDIDGSSVQVLSSKFPFLSSFRALVNIATCICILAVDFNVFPRKFAKAENFGTGIMDLGVGSFVISNALVSQTARNWNKIGGRSGLNRSLSFLMFQIVSSWPLLLLGALRLISVKLSGYHEHVSEYGVHWNFFFTLAVVKVLATVVLFIIPLNLCTPLALVIAAVYQYTLSKKDGHLTSILLDSDRTGGLVMQNKEGIASCFGYLSIYFAGVSLGAYIFKERRTLHHWKTAAKELVYVTILLWFLLHLTSYSIQPISRRLGNASYILWVLSQATFMLLLLLLVDIATTQYIHDGCLPRKSMPNSWIMEIPTSHSKINYRPPLPNKCLISAINRNQLFFFLLSNLLTGAVNGLFDTQSIGDTYAVALITVYGLIVSYTMWILHMKQITLKMW
uniref:Phosphatidylinositol-glycan biosynthesis class W protein n=1 Tax=Ciona savignyi TaxID=51511 RepID=H2Z6C6_CIOSA